MVTDRRFFRIYLGWHMKLPKKRRCLQASMSFGKNSKIETIPDRLERRHPPPRRCALKYVMQNGEHEEPGTEQ